MRKTQKIVALALGSIMAAALFAACGEDPKHEDDGGDKQGVALSARICFDNLPDDGIAISEADTKVSIPGAKDLSAENAAGDSVSADAVATYQDGVFTAVSAGVVKFTVNGQACRVEVVPAYVTNPGNQYSGLKSDDVAETRSKLLGGTHDPSIIEVEEYGKTVYYMVSTGWSNVSQVDRKATYGNAVHRSEDGMLTWEFVGRTFDSATREEDFVNTKAARFMYSEGHTAEDSGTPSGGNGYNADSASWWAPDIVPCPSGGYWLYTCVVDGSEYSGGRLEGMSLSGESVLYSRACILLYHSDTLEQGSFKPVMAEDGVQQAFVQCSIPRSGEVNDVNAIDPQIIYDPDGKMYMAYGSFGSGNYLLELDPQTGLRKDGQGWKTHDEIRSGVEEIKTKFTTTQNPDADNKAIGWEHDYFGKNISKKNMEAPVIARHDNVKVADETATYDANGEPTGVEGKTYYYSMHSYNGLADAYQMWGGRSESVWGLYRSVNGGIVYNWSPADSGNEGNKYMGAFKWSNKDAANKEIDIILPGHNDLFTTNAGLSLAAYITRTPSYVASEADGTFLVQTHQYYLNSMGDLCISPNRYAGEIDRSVSKEELFAYTNGGKFQMVQFENRLDTGSSLANIRNVSVEVQLTEDGKIKNASGSEIGSWIMYGKGYIKITFNTAQANGESVYYGVVRPAWLYEQGTKGKSGFTITCMGHSQDNRSMAMFMNAQSSMTGEGFVG